jgi:hypothetical protein
MDGTEEAAEAVAIGECRATVDLEKPNVRSRGEAGRTWRSDEVWVCLWNMWMWDQLWDHIGKKYICTNICVHMHVICICISHICKCGKLKNQSLLQIPPRQNCKVGSMDTDLLLSSPFCSYRTGSNDTTNFISFFKQHGNITDSWYGVFECFWTIHISSISEYAYADAHPHPHPYPSIRSYIHTHNIYVWRHWKGKFQGANQPRMKHRRGDLLWIFEVDGEWLCGTAQKGRPLVRGAETGEELRNWRSIASPPKESHETHVIEMISGIQRYHQGQLCPAQGGEPLAWFPRCNVNVMLGW